MVTELIVALDGPMPFELACRLVYEADVKWLKIGPQAMCSRDWVDLVRIPRLLRCGLFLDLKLADTVDTVRETVCRAVDLGVSSVSTFTDSATETAIEASAGSDLEIWQVLALTDGTTSAVVGDSDSPMALPDGFICPVSVAKQWREADVPVSLICPGIRLDSSDEFSNHMEHSTIYDSIQAGVDMVVVGRPIWQSENPISMARAFMIGAQA